MKKRCFWMLLAALPLALFADVKMNALFTEHAVLARSEKTPVYGKADAGEEVTVEIGGVKASTKAGSDGKWRVNLDLRQVGEGPFELVVSGKNQIKVADVLVGEVWLCSGQSNMQFQLRRAEGAPELIAASANPKIRLFQFVIHSSVTPEEEPKGSWCVVGPKNVGNFSAVGYLFGKKIQEELKCPVGLINNSWGGSGVEAWVTLDYLKGNPELAKWSEQSHSKYVEYPKNLANYLKALEAWKKECGLAEPPPEELPPADAVWTPKQTIQAKNSFGPAIIWYRKKIKLPSSFTKQGGSFNFFQHGTDATFYLDGKVIGHTTPEGTVQGSSVLSKRFAPNELTPGEHEYAVRYFCVYDDFPTLRLGYSLPGKNSLNAGFERTVIPLKALTDAQKAARPKRPGFNQDVNKVPELLYNALIHPLKPYRISGTVWYQGCTNAGRPWQYPAAIQGLIKEWRRDFECEFPFYYCQLANYTSKVADPNVQGWADIRAGQEGALELPKTGQAILIDCGEARDIHPLDKTTPANRLAAVALAKTYGKNIPYSGPVFKGKSVENGKMRVTFDFTDGGLVAKPLPEKYFNAKIRKSEAKLVRNSPNSQLEGFALAGADGKWFWADAKIDGNSVLVWSEKVPAPVNVRYAYQSNPTCNLYNGAGFPAGGFSK